MKKFKKLEKWFAVQLTDLVLCAEVRTKYGPKVFYTGPLWALKDNYAVCFDGFNYDGTHKLKVFELGKVDKAWIRTEEAYILDDYEIR